jgi:hypothetical protein
MPLTPKTEEGELGLAFCVNSTLVGAQQGEGDEERGKLGDGERLSLLYTPSSKFFPSGDGW